MDQTERELLPTLARTREYTKSIHAPPDRMADYDDADGPPPLAERTSAPGIDGSDAPMDAAAGGPPPLVTRGATAASPDDGYDYEGAYGDAYDDEGGQLELPPPSRAGSDLDSVMSEMRLPSAQGANRLATLHTPDRRTRRDGTQLGLGGMTEPDLLRQVFQPQNQGWRQGGIGGGWGNYFESTPQ